MLPGQQKRYPVDALDLDQGTDPAMAFSVPPGETIIEDRPCQKTSTT
jgi:hypothetical protein